MRRSMLFLPGNQPNMLQNGMVLKADSLILDLEDAVALDEKDAARVLVREALKNLDFGNREIVVRINSEPDAWFYADLDAVVDGGADAVMLPKTVGKAQVLRLDAELSRLEEKYNRKIGSTKIIPLVETCRGIELSYFGELATDRVVALALGGEDLAADLGCKRTREGTEIFYSRERLVTAAKAMGVDVIDTPFTDARDNEGLKKDAAYARSLGFTGKLAISPHHLRGINEAFSPTAAEIEHASEVLEAMRKGKAEGRGAISLHGKMIDKPVVMQAEKVLDIARKAGLLPQEERK